MQLPAWILCGLSAVFGTVMSVIMPLWTQVHLATNHIAGHSYTWLLTTSLDSYTWLLTTSLNTVTPGYWPHLWTQLHLATDHISGHSYTWLLTTSLDTVTPGYWPHLWTQLHLATDHISGHRLWSPSQLYRFNRARTNLPQDGMAAAPPREEIEVYVNYGHWSMSVK